MLNINYKSFKLLIFIAIAHIIEYKSKFKYAELHIFHINLGALGCRGYFPSEYQSKYTKSNFCMSLLFAVFTNRSYVTICVRKNWIIRPYGRSLSYIAKSTKDSKLYYGENLTIKKCFLFKLPHQ